MNRQDTEKAVDELIRQAAEASQLKEWLVWQALELNLDSFQIIEEPGLSALLWAFQDIVDPDWEGKLK